MTTPISPEHVGNEAVAPGDDPDDRPGNGYAPGTPAGYVGGQTASCIVNINLLQPHPGDGSIAAGVTAPSFPVTISNGSGPAIGHQSAGHRSTVTGVQAVHGDGHKVANHGTVAEREPAPEAVSDTWWTRWRKRGVVITLAAVVAAMVAVAQWLGWTPWS